MSEEIKLTPEEREARIRHIITGLLALGYPLEDETKINSLFQTALGKEQVDIVVESD